MKTLTVVLLVTLLVINISGYLIRVPTVPTIHNKETASTKWLHMQKLMIPLFDNVCEASNNAVTRRLSQEFTQDFGNYSEPQVIINLQKLISAGLLPKGEIFSEYVPEHIHELKTIYEVLYNASNFDSFYKAASWARQNLNCGLYVNAIYMAIQKRRDTERLSIPAPYELLPNYFVNKDALVRASSILVGREVTPTEGVRDEGNTYHIDANYTAMFYDNDDDTKLAYFCEDIGLNSYYFLRKLSLAPWFNDDINGRYGENMYQMMKQLMARYNLERYANGLPLIDGINLSSVPDIPYDPMLIYSDGSEFIHRTSPIELPVNEYLTSLQNIENNIVAVAGHMGQSGYNKTQILNHLMEILVTGERSYETLARQLLGKDQTISRRTSVLDHYMTSLRDPMFWEINKKIVDLVDSALKMLPPYLRNELYFPGVEIVNIDVKKMMTAYDYFELDVTDALKIDENNSTFDIKIGQPRLNHKQFTIKVNISSLVTKRGLLKIYLGPKMMPGELASKKNLFTLLDIFEINLKLGTNIITRTSDEMKHFSADFMSVKTIRKNVEDAEFGLESLPLKSIESQIGYPSRLILPKGTSQGLPLQFFVFIAPFNKGSISDSYFKNSLEFNSAILSPGYPLDLMVQDEQLFTIPNAMIKYVTVTHKGDSKVENYGGPGISKQWYSTNSYDPSTRPTYSANDRVPFDYNSKKRPSENYDKYPDKLNEYNIALQDSFVTDDNQNDVNKDSSNLLSSRKFDYSARLKSNNPYSQKIKTKQNNEKAILAKQEDTKQPKVMPLRAEFSHLVTSSKFASESEINEPFNHKEKETQFDKKKKEAFDANLSVIPKDVIFNKESEAASGLFAPSKFNTDQLDSKAKVSRKENYVRRDNNKYSTMVPLNIDITSDGKSKNGITSVPRLLKSTEFDYNTQIKRKEPFDYKARKEQYDKKDYSSKRGDYTKYRTLQPKEEEVTTIFTNTPKDLSRVLLEKDTNNLDLINKITGNEIDIENKEETYNDYLKQNNLMEVEQFPLSMLTKRTPTVYDFFFFPRDYEDSPEMKVYE